MAAQLTPDQIDGIVRLLETWPADTALTWEALRRLVRARLALTHTRQTLAQHDAVACAYRAAKASLRARAAECGGNRDLYPLVCRLRVTIDRLEAELALCQQRLVRWQYNAYKHGLKKRDLEAPVPTVDRGRTA